MDARMSTERIADAAVAASVTLFGVSLTTINLVVQIIAGLLAIVSGCIAIYYYIGKTRDARRDRLERVGRQND